MYRPDIIGVTRDRKVIEVELKQSVSDFKANSEKRGIQFRENGWACDYPVRFYFGVPRDLVDKVKPLLPEGAGLITVADWHTTWGPEIEVVTPAKHDKRATKLSVLQVGRMVMHQTATLHRAIVALANQAKD